MGEPLLCRTNRMPARRIASSGTGGDCAARGRPEIVPLGPPQPGDPGEGGEIEHHLDAREHPAPFASSSAVPSSQNQRQAGARKDCERAHV